MESKGLKDQSGRRKSILVMDDEEFIRTVISSMLRCLGYSATTCASGEKAIEMYRNAQEAGDPYQAVIMDLTVPDGMGGMEAAEHILALDPCARLIVSSGYSHDSVLATPGAYGFTGELPKPYRLSELAEVLDAVLAPAAGRT
jgi:two-component system, cell cycle sensor histidine kinase and response regulator CckA